MKVELFEHERVDDLHIKGYQIIQSPERFCFGMDAVLLSDFVRGKKNGAVLDMGTGTGIIPILLEATEKGKTFTALEIQEESAKMARRSVQLNDLEEKIEIITGDIKEASKLMKASSFDIVTCNPPYMNHQHGITNPELPKAIARHEILCTLEDVVREASKLVKPAGSFYLIHRPFRLAEIIGILLKYKLEPKRMRLVYPYIEKEPNMVMIEAVRGGKSMMKVEPPLIVYKEKGKYTEEIYKIYGYEGEDISSL